MVTIDSIVGAWVHAIGGANTVHNIISMVFVFTFIYIFYKVTT